MTFSYHTLVPAVTVDGHQFAGKVAHAGTPVVLTTDVELAAALSNAWNHMSALAAPHNIAMTTLTAASQRTSETNHQP